MLFRSLLLELVLVLPVVQVFGNRRSGSWSDFDKIESALMRLSEGFIGGEYAELVPVFIQDPHLRDTDLEIDA